MRPALAVVAAAALLAAAAAGARLPHGPATSSTTSGASLLRLPRATPAGETALWGHIESLTRKGARFELRFDPGLLLRGATAERAALEDTGSRDVPNDAYVVEEGHRLLTYVVAANARATVLSKDLRPLVVPVTELAQIVKGKNPRHRPLFARGNGLGFWIRVGSRYPNPILSLDQQYQP